MVGAVEQTRNCNEVGEKRKPMQPAGPPPKRLEPWQNTDDCFDAVRWSEVMDGHGVDKEAQQSLFLLCQHSPEGARAANSLVYKLVRAAAGSGGGIGNPSAFVMSGSMRARFKVEEQYNQGVSSWHTGPYTSGGGAASSDGDDDESDSWGNWRR